MTEQADAARRRGRPSDPTLDEQLRAAARAVLAEYGWRGTTVERLAERAGVARTTIYRRYGSLAGVLLRVTGDVYRDVPIPNTGSLRGDMVALMHDIAALWGDTALVEYVAAVSAAQIESPEFGDLYRTQVDRRRQNTAPIAERAVARGELASTADGELLYDLLAGVVMHRLLLLRRPLSDEYVTHLVDRVLGGFSP